MRTIRPAFLAIRAALPSAQDLIDCAASHGLPITDGRRAAAQALAGHLARMLDAAESRKVEVVEFHKRWAWGIERDDLGTAKDFDDSMAAWLLDEMPSAR